jgi:cyclase
LIFVDITATLENRKPDFELVDDFADECFMPLTVGGGVTEVEDVKRLLQVGADKVAINSAAVNDPELIIKSAKIFGSQCIVASIDVKKNDEGKYEVYTHSGAKHTGIDPVEHANNMEKAGAGEILITSIENDGTMQGYDIDITKQIAAAVNIPVIASGGAGNYEHMLNVLNIKGVESVAAASIFHFTELTPLGAKTYLKGNGIKIRL